MGAIVGILGLVVGLGALVCWIMVLIKMFSAEVVQGVLGLICGLWAFIWGWMHADEYGLRNIMMIWTGLIVLSILLNVGSTALGLGGGIAPVAR